MSERTVIRLNEQLLAQQGVSEEQKHNLVSLYSRLKYILDDPDIFNHPESMVRSIEFELQDNWNFERDDSKHKYWNRLKGCSCPELDNNERWGVAGKVYNMACKWHGISES